MKIEINDDFLFKTLKKYWCCQHPCDILLGKYNYLPNHQQCKINKSDIDEIIKQAISSGILSDFLQKLIIKNIRGEVLDNEDVHNILTQAAKKISNYKSRCEKVKRLVAFQKKLNRNKDIKSQENQLKSKLRELGYKVIKNKGSKK